MKHQNAYASHKYFSKLALECFLWAKIICQPVVVYTNDENNQAMRILYEFLWLKVSSAYQNRLLTQSEISSTLSDGWWLAISKIKHKENKFRFCFQAIKQFIDLLNSQHQPRKVITPETAIQYLSARKFDVRKAVELYEANNLTRQREGLFGIDSKIDPLRSELETGKFTVLVSTSNKSYHDLPLVKAIKLTATIVTNSFIKRRSM